ncbi:MAG TPA: hypothetical protein VFO55_02755, partial [Gemmatimonadaceae bacterium]|nr:hypothetical protein [Gemmatimonadaceae bacterium]
MAGLSFSLPWALALCSALVWTTAFSLLQPPVRGLRNVGDGDRRSLAPLMHGFLAWPIMLPEVVEYVLAEVGVLTPPTMSAEHAP